MKWVRASANVDRVACPWADVAEDEQITPQSAGLAAIARGFALVHGEADQEKIRLESPMYDALYAWCQRELS
jgi:hypothetical protein